MLGCRLQCLVDVVDSERNPVHTDLVGTRRLGLDRVGVDVLEELKATVTVRRLKHRELDVIAIESDRSFGPLAADGVSAEDCQTEIGEEIDRSIEVSHGDTDVFKSDGHEGTVSVRQTGVMGAETIPILPSADFDLSASFWAEFGFVELGRWPDYLILGHPQLEIELHFWLNSKVDRWTNDVACYVRFDSPDAAVACHAGWSRIAVPEPAVLSSPKSEPWGAVEFHVIDVNGNLVRFGGFPPA